MSCRWAGGRQLNPKFTAGAGTGFDTECSTHAFDGFADDGQAHAGSFVVQLGMDAFEHVEEAVLVFLRNADAVIMDEHRYVRTAVFGPDFDLWFGSFWNKFYRVAEQI